MVMRFGRKIPFHPSTFKSITHNPEQTASMIAFSSAHSQRLRMWFDCEALFQLDLTQLYRPVKSSQVEN